MNKILIVAVIIVADSGFVRCSAEQFLQHVKSRPLREYLKENAFFTMSLDTFNKKCPNGNIKIDEGLRHLEECVSKSNRSLTICDAIRTYTMNCTAPVVQVFEDCVSHEAKGLPTLVLKSLLSTLDYLCKLEGELILELMNSCLWEALDASTNEELRKCEGRVLISIDKFGETAPSPGQLCRAVADMRNCLQTVVGLQDRCKNKKTRDAFLGLYDALAAPCANVLKI